MRRPEGRASTPGAVGSHVTGAPYGSHLHIVRRSATGGMPARAGRLLSDVPTPSTGAPVSLPPLVEPAESLTVDEVRRYSRHLIMPDVGMAGQKRLKNAKVLCVGAGGLGSPALMYLAAAGVGTLGIVDFDVVDVSNLQRQIIHGHERHRPAEGGVRRGPRQGDQPRTCRSTCTPIALTRRTRSSCSPSTTSSSTAPTTSRRATSSTTPACSSASRTSTGRSSASTGRPACSGPSTARATAASIRSRRRPGWCRPAPRAACSACCRASSARSRPTRRSS